MIVRLLNEETRQASLAPGRSKKDKEEGGVSRFIYFSYLSASYFILSSALTIILSDL